MSNATSSSSPVRSHGARPSVSAVIAALVLLGFAALLGMGAEAPSSPDGRFAPPAPQHALEDWRGNSAGGLRPAD